MTRQPGGVVAAPARAHAVVLEVGRDDVRAGAEGCVALHGGAVVEDGVHGHVGARADPVAGADLVLDVLNLEIRVGLVELSMC